MSLIHSPSKCKDALRLQLTLIWLVFKQHLLLSTWLLSSAGWLILTWWGALLLSPLPDFSWTHICPKALKPKPNQRIWTPSSSTEAVRKTNLRLRLFVYFNTAGAQAARDDDEWRGRSMSFKSSLKRHTPSSCLLTVFKVALLLHITPRLLWTKAVHQAYTSGFSQCLINSWLTKCEMCVRINSCTIKSCTDMEWKGWLFWSRLLWGLSGLAHLRSRSAGLYMITKLNWVWNLCHKL